MTNADILELLPNKENLREVLERQRAELAALEAEAEQLRGHVERHQAMVATLDAVTEVRDEVALSISELKIADSFDRLVVRATGTGIERWASAYPNEHNMTTWGLNLYEPGFGIDRHFGSDWTKEDALEAAKRFVATGKVPEKQ